MSVKFDRSETPGTIHCTGVLDIACAAELKAALLQALETGTVRVNLRDATEMDVTALQLLAAAERAAREARRAFSTEGPVPDAIRSASREAGFARFPGDPGRPCGGEQ